MNTTALENLSKLVHHGRLVFFFKIYIFYLFIFREVGGREKERERNINVWLPFTGPNWGPGPQPRHVP